MNKSLVFVGGFLLGVICTFLAFFLIGNATSTTANPETGLSYLQGVTLSDRLIEFDESFDFEVIQVVDKGALSLCRSRDGNPELGICPSYLGATVFIVDDVRNMFYDGQIVKVSEGKKAYQIGIYQYMTKTVKQSL